MILLANIATETQKERWYLFFIVLVWQGTLPAEGLWIVFDYFKHWMWA